MTKLGRLTRYTCGEMASGCASENESCLYVNIFPWTFGGSYNGIRRNFITPQIECTSYIFFVKIWGNVIIKHGEMHSTQAVIIQIYHPCFHFFFPWTFGGSCNATQRHWSCQSMFSFKKWTILPICATVERTNTMRLIWSYHTTTGSEHKIKTIQPQAPLQL